MNKPRIDVPAPAPPAPHFVDPADANLEFDWIAGTLSPIGIAVIMVGFDGANVAEVVHQAGPMFEDGIGRALSAARLGEFDSMKRGQKFALFFYVHRDSVAEALALIKSQLEGLRILRFAVIAHADPAANAWKQFYPAPPDVPFADAP